MGHCHSRKPGHVSKQLIAEPAAELVLHRHHAVVREDDVIALVGVLAPAGLREGSGLCDCPLHLESRRVEKVGELKSWLGSARLEAFAPGAPRAWSPHRRAPGTASELDRREIARVKRIQRIILSTIFSPTATQQTENKIQNNKQTK